MSNRLTAVEYGIEFLKNIPDGVVTRAETHEVVCFCVPSSKSMELFNWLNANGFIVNSSGPWRKSDGTIYHYWLEIHAEKST